MGFWVGEGVVASFGVAVRLMELPQGVFGISLATYLLPTLSGMAAEKKYAEFRTTLSQGLVWLIFINLLAAALLFSLAEPMMRLLFERGAGQHRPMLRRWLCAGWPRGWWRFRWRTSWLAPFSRWATPKPPCASAYFV
jgi:O-antigen/teichoic acid export membrane protein